MQSGIDLSDGIFAGSHAEFLTQGYPHGRSHLGDDPFFRIVDGFPNVGDALSNGDRSRRADGGALAAVDAFRFRQLPVKGGRHNHVGPPVDEIDGAHMLDLAAHPDAVAAEDAFVHVADDGRRRVVDGIIRPVVFKADMIQAEPAGQKLQLAFLVFLTDRAVPAVGGQKQFQDHLPVVVKLRCVGADHHFVLGRRGAGSDNVSSLILHHAHPACAVNGQIRIVAEGRDRNADFPDYL